MWQKAGITNSTDSKIKSILIGIVLKKKFNLSRKASLTKKWKNL